MTKVITSLALVCLTLLALPNSFHGRYLLVELDAVSVPAEGGEEPMVPEVPEVPEEPVPEDAEVPETLPEYDQEEPVDPVTQKPVPRRRQTAKKGFRAGKDSKPIPGPKKNKKPTPKGAPITDVKLCNEENKCVSNVNGTPKKGTASGRFWSACAGYPYCSAAFGFTGCYYNVGAHQLCFYG